MTISGLRLWRRFAAALALAVLLTITAVGGVHAQPAQAAVNTYGWPNDPMRNPRAAKQPWQCGLPSWMPGYGKCKTCSTYVDGFYDIRYGGPNAQKAVTALLATSGTPCASPCLALDSAVCRPKWTSVVVSVRSVASGFRLQDSSGSADSPSSNEGRGVGQ